MTFLSRTLLATAVLLSPLGSTPAAAGTRCTVSVPYVSGRDGYASYRIPAVVTTLPHSRLRSSGGTPMGTLLAFAEGRRDGSGDTGDIDIVLRRSTDGGCTWGPLTVVAAGHGDTRGNPAPVVDPRTGAVVLVSCSNDGSATEAKIMRGEAPGRRVYVQHSWDDGRSFTAPQDITDDVRLPTWRWYATGPGHALALTRGPYAGRLVVPANHSAAPPIGSPDTGRESRYYGAHALVSDDGGRHWRLGFVDGGYDGAANANESTAAQLPDGRVYFNARDQGGTAPGNRLDAFSADGGESLLTSYAPQPTLADVPVVQGSVLQLDRPGGPLLFSGPSEPTARRSLAVWQGAETPAGLGFSRAVTLSALPAAYSDLVAVDADTTGVLYETGATGPYETIEFRRLEGF